MSYMDCRIRKNFKAFQSPKFVEFETEKDKTNEFEETRKTFKTTFQSLGIPDEFSSMKSADKLSDVDKSIDMMIE